MDTTLWSTLDSINETLNATTALPTSKSADKRSMTIPIQLVATVGLIVPSIGVCANIVVLTVLIRARRQFGNSTHTLIVNQCAADLCACSFAFLSFIVVMIRPKGYKYNGHNKILDGAVCFLFESTALVAFGLTAGIVGLMVITLERYFKIVHAIAHRKYYRNWMTKVGVALPWIGGTCLILLPGMGTSRVVNGICLRMGVWPNEGMEKAFAFVRFLWHFAIPVSVFVYCYGRIFQSIRRQNKVVTGHAGHGHGTATTGQNTGHAQQQATGASTGAKLSRTELNVIQTMVIVIALFVICWSLVAISNALGSLGVGGLDNVAFLIGGAVAFSSFSVNPFIYASRYEVFRRALKQMLTKTSAVTPAANIQH